MKRSVCSLARAILSVAVLPLAASIAVKAALPDPFVEFRFSEGTGTQTANEGTLGGSGTFVQTDQLPVFSSNVPTGLYTPSANTSAVDFGTIAAGQGGRALDLTPAGEDPTLGTFSAFTISGWLNARNLTEGFGGNRIAFALSVGNGPGFDLVQLSNGSLRIGINQWPDGGSGGPSSSPGRITANADAAPANWVFFTVTYDSSLPTGNLKYYFGSPTALASLDSAHNYLGGAFNGGLIESTGPLTLGNFGTVIGARTELGPAGGSRNFRGLMDEIRIYDRALTDAEIQSEQLNGATAAVPVTITSSPTSKAVFAGQSVSFSVQANGSAPLTYQWQRGTTDIPDANEPTYTIPAALIGDNNVTFRAKVSNAASPSGVFSEAATLTVREENNHKVSFSFSEGNGTVVNRGNLGGSGQYVVGTGFPAASAKVPTGAFAPTDNVSSVDFGAIAAGQGGRAIDLTNPIDNTMGPMNAFTIAGWLNARELNIGAGGNRIAFALTTGNGPGFDLVQLASGGLRLGINQWPDGANGGGPFSGEGRITADPEAGANNWVFFAVTYDSSLEAGHVNYYFGNPSEAAALDSTIDYPRGPIVQSGQLTIGNFGSVVSARTATGPANSRVFRGLMDEVNIYNKALTLAEVQNIQKMAAFKPVVIDPVVIAAGQPADQTIFAGGQFTLNVSATGTPPLAFQWWRKRGAAEALIDGATTSSLNVTDAQNGDEYWIVVNNQAGTVTSRRAVITVLPETGEKVVMSFSEGSGLTSANAGNIGGAGQFVQNANFPAFSSLTPSGDFAPANNTSSVDFGLIGAGEGGRAIDLVPAVTPTLGSLNAFTITAWLNARDLTPGWGGNRIVYTQTAPGQNGFDLVQESGGILWLGVNQWPDAQPNSPAKSIRTLPVDPEAGAANWTFIAVTYDGLSALANANFYFGTPTEAATLDISVDYDKGPITATGPLAIGNFSPVDAGARGGNGPNNPSRVFRGLIDEVRIFNRVLTLEEILTVQKASPTAPPAEGPTLSVSKNGNELVLRWTSTATFKIESKASLTDPQWTTVVVTPETNGAERTARLPIGTSNQFFRLNSQN